MWGNTKELYSTLNEENLLLLKDLLEPWKKIYKCINSLSKSMYIDKVDDMVGEYNNTYCITIKIKPADVKLSTHIDLNVKNNDKDPKFEVGDHVKL